jgi:hypothetical protein
MSFTVQANVLGQVFQIDALNLSPPADYVFEKPCKITSYTGPDGPTADIYIRGDGQLIVTYGGKLTNGNHFGSCDIVIAYTCKAKPKPRGFLEGIRDIFHGIATGQATQRPQPKVVSDNVTGTATITPPTPATYNPTGLSIVHGQPGAPGPVKVAIQPQGVYEIVFKHHDEMPRNMQVNPTMLSTGQDGQGTVNVRDMIGVFPRGPIPVTGTISPHAPCTGNAVESSFTVTVT